MAARGGTTAGGTCSDQDDFVDYEEFESIMLSLTGDKDNWPESKLRELFENLDADGSGKVSLEKFFQRSLVDAKRSRGSSLGMHAFTPALPWSRCFRLDAADFRLPVD